MIKNLIVILLGVANLMVGQMLQLPKNIQSPNAASLGKYGDIPMNYYTGRANVNIPLYSLNEGGIPLDISLSYDTGGVRVNDVPGWVGQNWTLNAGGVITRTVKGQCADEIEYNLENYFTNKKFGFRTSNAAQYLNNNDWSSINNLKFLINNQSIYERFQDTEPDIFTFNFLGFSGKFFLGNDGEWKISSENNLKVEIKKEDYIIPMNFPSVGPNGTYYQFKKFPRVIGKITITDENGNKYVFGENQNAIEFSVPDFFNQINSPINSNSWYLSSVYDKNNNLVYEFDYERGDLQAHFYLTNSYIDFKKFSNGTWNSTCGYTISQPKPEFVSGQLIFPIYLKEIKSKSKTSIVFTSSNTNKLKYMHNETYFYSYFQNWYNTTPPNSVPKETYFYDYCFFFNNHKYDENGTLIHNHLVNSSELLKPIFDNLFWRQLESIEMKNGNSIESVVLVYNSNKNQRLSLSQVIQRGGVYKFEYDRMELLPQTFLSMSVDHFGYFNNKSYSISDKENHYNNRQTDPTTVLYGSLKKVTYPTGGWTEFEYEPHTYSKSVNEKRDLINDNGIIGGLRVKKIISFSDNSNKITKEYLYTNNINSTTSNGILITKPKYLYEWIESIESTNDYKKIMYNINSVIPLGNFSGTYIEYPIVIEKTTDGTLLNGYTIYNYTNYQDYKDILYINTLSQNHSVFDAKIDFSYKRSKLKSKQVFDQNNNLKFQEDFNYTENNIQKIKAFNYERYYPCSSSPTFKDIGNAYEIYYSDFKLKEKITKNYFPTGTVEERTNYNYFSRENFGDTFLKSTEVTDTQGKKRKEELTYAFEKTGTEPFTTLTNRREFSVVENKKYLDANLLQTTKTDYANFSISNKNYLFPKTLWEAKGANALEEKLIIDTYDADGNILLAHTKEGNYIHYAYAYNNKYPIAKAEGNKNDNLFSSFTSLVNLVNSSSSPYNSSIVNQQRTLINSFNDLQFTFYTYKPEVGVTSITSPNGIIEYYYYDRFNRLIRVIDEQGNIIKNIDYNLKK